MMAAFFRALLVASAALYSFNATAIYAGIYPWSGKIDPNDIYIYKISGQILWAVIFALIAERISIAGVEGMPRKATMLACAFFSVSGLATALILMSDRGRSVTG
ncbi:hypothetical protein ACWIGM_03215 [Bosea sp. NPDC055332]